MKHTPGPWQLWKDAHPRAIPRPNIVILPEQSDDGHGSKYVAVGGGNIEANARLIAAAPELLEALELMYKRCNLSSDDAPHRVKARAAIAKAKGEAR